MKVSQNFIAQELVPKAIFNRFGDNSTWFINPRVVACAEFYKSFFTTYYKNKYGNDKVKTVLIVINDWHTGGARQFRGYRPPDCTEGQPLSQHRLANGFDCDIIIVFNDGTRIEADYKEVHEVIMANEAEFMANGVSRIEDISIASTWMHTDCAWIPNQTKILIVKPS